MAVTPPLSWSSDGDEEVPDRIAPIVGWRAWRIWNGELGSMRSPTLWHPRSALRAACYRAGLAVPAQDHQSPQKFCSCGIYAARNIRTLPYGGQVFLPSIVFGRVALWGRVVVAEAGYRAEYAYPFCFFAPQSQWTVLGEFGVPIMSLDDYVAQTLQPQVGQDSQPSA